MPRVQTWRRGRGWPSWAPVGSEEEEMKESHRLFAFRNDNRIPSQLHHPNRLHYLFIFSSAPFFFFKFFLIFKIIYIYIPLHLDNVFNKVYKKGNIIWNFSNIVFIINKLRNLKINSSWRKLILEKTIKILNKMK